MKTEDVLGRVSDIIKDRESDYGCADVMFKDIARRWGCSGRDVATRMAELKMARLAYKWSDDSAIDAIAYLVFAIMFADDAFGIPAGVAKDISGAISRCARELMAED